MAKRKNKDDPSISDSEATESKEVNNNEADSVDDEKDNVLMELKAHERFLIEDEAKAAIDNTRDECKMRMYFIVKPKKLICYKESETTIENDIEVITKVL